jgi:hypothetical protein
MSLIYHHLANTLFVHVLVVVIVALMIIMLTTIAMALLLCYIHVTIIVDLTIHAIVVRNMLVTYVSVIIVIVGFVINVALNKR